MAKFWIFIFIFICQHRVFSQIYTGNDGAHVKHFIYEVKDIDEFFDRFNDEPGSFIRGVYSTHHLKFDISRQRLIKSLFNYENRSRDNEIMKKFIADVTRKKHPVYLDFYGDDWYAQLTCKFKYNGTVIRIPVIMKIEVAENKGSKWMIVAIGSSNLKSKIDVTAMAVSKVNTKIISPTSHGTNFVSLRKALDDKENLSSYFEAEYIDRSHMLEFYNAVLNRKIEFLGVSKIKYHFLLADRWIFTVEDFTREALNSGWLINRLQAATPAKIESYRDKLLSGN